MPVTKLAPSTTFLERRVSIIASFGDRDELNDLHRSAPYARRETPVKHNVQREAIEQLLLNSFHEVSVLSYLRRGTTQSGALNEQRN